MKVDGKQIANRLKEEIKSLNSFGAPKKISIFYAGQNPVIDKYISLKEKFGKDVGISVSVFRFPESVDENTLINTIKLESENFDGVVVQLPLPSHIDKANVMSALPLEKDIDVLSDRAIEASYKRETMRLPAVVGAVDEIIRECNIDLENKKILVIGRGSLVGKPVALWLQREGFMPEIVDKDTKDISEMTKNSDVIISGTGVPSLIKPEMIKEGSVLLDAGSSTDGGELRGDIDPACEEKAKFFSGVPGGIGPITIAKLFQNLFL